MRIVDATLRLLSAALDTRQRRHDLLAGDLANADTPGFRGQDLDSGRATARHFMAQEAAARQAEAATWIATPGGPESASKMTIGAPSIASAQDTLDAEAVEMPGATPGLDGNTVDLDRTMIALAENGVEYAALTKVVAKKMGIIRYIISEGR